MVSAISVDLDENEMKAAQQAVAVLAAVQAFLPRLKGGEWVTQSPTLRADDQRTAPFQMTHWVDGTMANAFEHLYAFHRTLGLPEELTLPRGPGYTLIRGAIESAVAVWWVLEPDARKERVHRRLRIWEYSRQQESKAINSTGLAPDRDLQHRWDENAKQFSSYIGHSRIKAMPTFTDLLKSFDRANASRSESSWRLCSGFAHGIEWAGALLHELTDLRSIGGELNEAVSIARWAVIGPCVDTAGLILLAALDRIDQLGRIDGRPTSRHGSVLRNHIREAAKIAANSEEGGPLAVPVLIQGEEESLLLQR